MKQVERAVMAKPWKSPTERQRNGKLNQENRSQIWGRGHLYGGVLVICDDLAQDSIRVSACKQHFQRCQWTKHDRLPSAGR